MSQENGSLTLSMLSMKRFIVLTLMFLGGIAHASGPKFMGQMAPKPVYGSSNTAWSSLYQETLNLYHDIQYPQISTGTAQNFTIINASMTNLTIPSNGTITGIGGRHLMQLPIGATTTSQTSTTSTSFVATNLTATITPTSTSSKIIILVSGNIDMNNNSSNGDITLYRNSTTNLGSSTGLIEIGTPGSNFENRPGAAMVYMDSPASTSATTYTVYIRNNNSSATTLIWGADGITQSMILAEVQ